MQRLCSKKKKKHGSSKNKGKDGQHRQSFKIIRRQMASTQGQSAHRKATDKQTEQMNLQKGGLLMMPVMMEMLI